MSAFKNIISGFPPFLTFSHPVAAQDLPVPGDWLDEAAGSETAAAWPPAPVGRHVPLQSHRRDGARPGRRGGGGRTGPGRCCAATPSH